MRHNKSSLRKNILAGILSLGVLLTCVDVTAQVVDSTPSVNAFGLWYNSGGTFSIRDVELLGYRYQMVVVPQVSWEGGTSGGALYASPAVQGAKSINSNLIVLIYNSTDLFTTIGGSVQQFDTMAVYMGATISGGAITAGYPKSMFYYDDVPENLTIGGQPDEVTVGLNSATTLQDTINSQRGRFIGYTDRRWLNWRIDSVIDAQIFWNKELLGGPIQGTVYYPDGIWWDNMGASASLQTRQDGTLFSGSQAFITSMKSQYTTPRDVAWWFDMQYQPSDSASGCPTCDSTGLAIFFDNQIKMIKKWVDTANVVTGWHPLAGSAPTLTQVYNYAEIRFDLDWSGFFARDEMYTTDGYAYLEHVPKLHTGGGILGSGSMTNASTLASTAWYSGKSPMHYWRLDSALYANNGTGVIYHPGFPAVVGNHPYGDGERMYSDLSWYYLVRNQQTWLKMHYNNWVLSSAYNPDMTEDELIDNGQWLPAYTINFGDTTTDFISTNPPYAWAFSQPADASVDVDRHGNAVTVVENVGKTSEGNNWVIFRRDIPSNGNIVLFFPKFADIASTDTAYTPLIALGGTYYQITERRDTLSAQTSVRMRPGTGMILTDNAPTGAATALTLVPIGNKAFENADGASVSYTFDVLAHGGLTDPIKYTVDASNLLNGTMTINNYSGQVIWVPDAGGFGPEGNYSVTFTVTNEESPTPATQSEIITFTVQPSGAPPIVTLNSIGTKTVEEGNTLSFTLAGTNGVTPYTFSKTETVALPSPASTFNTGTGVFSWVAPASGAIGTYTINFGITDQANPQGSDNEIINVNVIAPLPLSLNTIGPKGATEGIQIQFSAAGSGGTTPYVYTFAENVPVLPIGHNAIINSSSGIFTWTPQLADAGVYDVTITVTDGLSATANEVVTITVVAAVPPTGDTTIIFSPANPNDRIKAFYIDQSAPNDHTGSSNSTFIYNSLSNGEGTIVEIPTDTIPTAAALFKTKEFRLVFYVQQPATLEVTARRILRTIAEGTSEVPTSTAGLTNFVVSSFGTTSWTTTNKIHKDVGTDVGTYLYGPTTNWSTKVQGDTASILFPNSYGDSLMNRQITNLKVLVTEKIQDTTQARYILRSDSWVGFEPYFVWVGEPLTGGDTGQLTRALRLKRD